MKVKNYVLLVSALIASVGPAFAADYLVQQPNDTVPTMIVSKSSAPIVGQDVPAGSRVAPFVPQSGDAYPGNYRISESNVVSYSPPAPPVVAQPDPNAPKVLEFQTAIFNDNDLPIESRMAIADKFPLINQFMSVAPVQMTMYWAGLKMGAGTTYPWLTPEMIAKVEAYAETYHIPLVAPEQ